MTRAELLAQTVLNPQTNNKVKVSYALTLPKDHPAYKAAKALVGKLLQKEPAQPQAPRSGAIADEKSREIVLGVMTARRFTPADIQEFEWFGKEYLDGMSPIDIVAAFLPALGVTDPSQVKAVDVYTRSGRAIARRAGRGSLAPAGEAELEFSIELTSGARLKRRIYTDDDTGKLTMENVIFFLSPDEKRGTGYGRRMLQTTMQLADRLGIEEVTVEATMESGGYVWAKYGGIPDKWQRPTIYKRVYKRLTQPEEYLDNQENKLYSEMQYHQEALATMPRNDPTRPWHEEQLKRIQKKFEQLEEYKVLLKDNPRLVEKLSELLERELAKSPDPRIEEMSEELLTFIAGTKLGKFLLLGTSWDGKFDMRKGSWGRQTLEVTTRQGN